MKWIKLLLFVLSTLGLNDKIFAISTQPVCFDILWQSSGDEGSPGAKQKDGPQYFVFINDSTSVPFTFDQSQNFRQKSDGTFTLSHSSGCTDASNFEIGSNSIKMSFILGDGVPLLRGVFKVTVSLLLPNRNRVVIGDETFFPDANRLQWGFYRNYTASLSDLAPNVFAKTEEIEGKIQADLGEIGTLNQSIDVDLANYAKVFDSIKDKNFLELTEEDLNAYQVAVERYVFLKQDIQGKQAAISKKTEELKSATVLAKAQIEAAIANEGLDIKASDILTIDVSIPLDPVSSVDKALSGQTYPYDEWANQTLQELQYLIGNEQRAQFLEKALVWTLQTEHLLTMIQTRASLSKEELNAFDAASTKVKGYIFGGVNGQPGVLTADFWFKDLGVDTSIRDAIDGPLAARNPEAAKKLKANINGLKILSESIVSHLKAMSDIARMYQSAQSESEKSFIDKLVAGAMVVIEQAPTIAECLAKSSAVGPYADFYALTYERDFCTDEPNDTIDQLIAGTGLALAAGTAVLTTPLGSWVVGKALVPVQFLKRVTSAVGRIGKSHVSERLDTVGEILGTGVIGGTVKTVEEGRSVGKKIFDSAKSLGIKTSEKFKRLTEWMKKPLIPGEAGSIKWKPDLFVDLASSQKRIHILNGDLRGGGHMWPGKPGKSVFPETWDGDKIMHEVSDVVTDPNIEWKTNIVVQGKQRYKATGIRDGVEIDVIIEPEGVGIVTAFPQSGPGVIRNP